MQLMFFLALIVMMVASLTNSVKSNETPAQVVDASAQVDQYRVFMYAAAQYMQTYSAGSGTLTWDTIKTASAVPPAARNVSMPLNWKIVAASDNSWVACTQMDERAAGIAQQLAVQGGQGMVGTNLNGNNYLVVGQATDVSKANQCQSIEFIGNKPALPFWKR